MPDPRRAVVLSGGGAKGIFESGVVHALAQTGYEADVITGSSVGALNAVGYAEVVRARREEGPEASLATADSLLTLWQRLDRLRVADLDHWGWRPLSLAVGLVVLGALLVAAAFSGVVGLNWLSLLERTAGFLLGVLAVFAGAVTIGVWIDLPAKLRTHVWKGRVGEEAKTPEADARLGEMALRIGGFLPSLFTDHGLRRAVQLIVPKHRRLSEYKKAGLDVRLTRTNVRTGRTEISEFLEPRDLDRPGLDRGLRVIGDPRALEAALASSAFPGAFPAVAADAVYVADENRSLYARARDRWLAKRELQHVFGESDSKLQYVWLMALLERVSDENRELTRTGNERMLLDRIRGEFYGARAAWSRVSVGTIVLLCETRGWPQIPVPGESPYADRYIDGAILDNTPLSTALTALREADAEAKARPESHEMLVIMLSPRKRGRYLAARLAGQLEGPALGMRALRLQAEGRIEDDVRNALKIDELLAKKGALEEAPVAATSIAAAAPSIPGEESWAELFQRERGDDEDGVAPPAALHVDKERLVHVDVTRVYPTWDLPWIFALDDRLGFNAQDARQFQVRGCRDTLVALATRSDGSARPRRAVELTGSQSGQVAVGWICPAERCSLRVTCDAVAAAERAEAKTEGAVARA